jgi:fructokinase
VSVLSLGEVLVDCFGEGRFPGGAPANVAYHVAALGEFVAIVSRVGKDPSGSDLADWLKSGAVQTHLLQTDDVQATGMVNVSPGPRYEIAAPAAWDFIELTDAARSAAASAGVVVFGTLAQRQPVSRRTIRSLVETARAARVPALCDLNLRAPFYDEESVVWCLRNCDVLKLNREELEVVSRLLHARGESGDLFVGLLREFGIPRGVLTDAGNGAWFLEEGEGEVHRQPAEEMKEFADAVGAGDAFAAVLAVAVSRGRPLRSAAASAAALAAFVVSQPGATPEMPRKITTRINAMLGA